MKSKAAGWKERTKLEGTKIHYLSIITWLGNGYYACRCDCGVVRRISAQSLMRGSTKSCGCKAGELRRLQMQKEKAKAYKPVPKYE